LHDGQVFIFGFWLDFVFDRYALFSYSPENIRRSAWWWLLEHASLFARLVVFGYHQYKIQQASSKFEIINSLGAEALGICFDFVNSCRHIERVNAFDVGRRFIILAV